MMITRYEWAWLHWWASTKRRGTGAIVDLGPWLGGTTKAIAAGLRPGPGTIHAYDQFLWEPFMANYVDLPHEPGDSFLDQFRIETAAIADRVEIHAGDMAELGWSGQPIELLVNDATKTLRLSRALYRDFVPAMHAGAWLLEQDFAHWLTGWVVVHTYRLRHHLGWSASLPGAGSVAFRVRRPIDAEAAASVTAELADDDEAARAFAWGRRLVSGHARQELLIAEAMWPHHLGETELARRRLHALDLPADRVAPAVAALVWSSC